MAVRQACVWGATVLAFVLSWAPPLVLAFGGVGHHTIGVIADSRLAGTNARERIRELIVQGDPDNGVAAVKCSTNAQPCTLAKYAVWADCAKGREYCPLENDGDVWLDGEMRVFDQRFPEHHAFHYTDILIQE